MMGLKENDEMTWQYLKDNFSIIKTDIPFCSIGSDHPLEQNKNLLKVNGGVVGLTQNPTALQDFALHRQVLRLCVHNFRRILE